MKFLNILFVALLCTFAVSAATVDTLSVPSVSMKRNLRTLVIVPDAARLQPGVSFPVLYLLHGYDGDAGSWLIIKPDLPGMADRDGVIVVCPSAENNWYWDSPRDSTVRFETFVSRELLDYIDAHYPTIADRSGRAISGLSMGGHGAMRVAMRHKDHFGAAGTTSGGLDIRPFSDNWNMKEMLGERKGNETLWDAYTTITQIDSISNGDLALIVDCGYGDFFFEVNQDFHNKLLERKIDHDYLVRPGAHNIPYWSNALDYQWLFFTKFFDATRRRK